jgi:membrane protein implicated in regulation of membrane protease activity
MTILRILAAIALLVSAAWLAVDRSFEPAVSTITSLSALLALQWARRQRRDRPEQRQAVGPHGVGIQAGGDVSIEPAASTSAKGRDA